MTPADLIAVAKILALVGAWPVATTMGVVVIGPWVALIVVLRSQDKRVEAIRAGQGKRFEEVVQMYKASSGLVQAYNNFAGEMVEVVKSNTASITRLVEHLEHRTPCYKFVRGQPAAGNGEAQ